MKNIDKKNNVSCANQDLFIELNDRNSETVSGGRVEIFKIRNQTNNIRIPYSVDGVRTPYPKPGQGSLWSTGRGGIITFDFDFRRAVVKKRKYNLANGRKYAFRLNKKTRYRFDINLYNVGKL